MSTTGPLKVAGSWAEPELKPQFLTLLARSAPRHDVQVYHWAILANHFHLAAEALFRGTAPALGSAGILANLRRVAGHLTARSRGRPRRTET